MDNNFSKLIIKNDKVIQIFRKSHKNIFLGSSSFTNTHINGKGDVKFSIKEVKKCETVLKKNKNDKTPVMQKMYKLNKNKVRDKCFALSNLKMSKKFMAFYSVSFPEGFPDKAAISVMNNVLTNVRSKSLKFNYLWIVERQKNGTIHFHMLVNRYFNIRVFNYKFACAIENELLKNNDNGIKFNKSRYNGCDVVKVRSWRGVSQYISKYVSKSVELFKCRTLGMDRRLSKMFTSVMICSNEVDYDYNKHCIDENGNIKRYDATYCTIFYVRGLYCIDLFRQLFDFNDKLNSLKSLAA